MFHMTSSLQRRGDITGLMGGRPLSAVRHGGADTPIIVAGGFDRAKEARHRHQPTADGIVPRDRERLLVQVGELAPECKRCSQVTAVAWFHGMS